MRIFKRHQQFCVVFLVCFLSGCSGVSYQYKVEGESFHQEMSVPVGETKGTVEFSVLPTNFYPLIETYYPTISAHYSSDSNTVNKFKYLDVKLIVEGKEIEPDTVEYFASYANTYLEFDRKDCCAMLGERLGIDVSQKDDPFGFSVDIRKKYKSLNNLPPEITVIVSAISDNGTTEVENKFTRSSYKDSNFIRVH